MLDESERGMTKLIAKTIRKAKPAKLLGIRARRLSKTMARRQTTEQLANRSFKLVEVIRRHQEKMSTSRPRPNAKAATFTISVGIPISPERVKGAKPKMLKTAAATTTLTESGTVPSLKFDRITIAMPPHTTPSKAATLKPSRPKKFRSESGSLLREKKSGSATLAKQTTLNSNRIRLIIRGLASSFYSILTVGNIP